MRSSFALVLVAVALVAAASQGSHAAPSALRPPNDGERARIVHAVDETWAYESRPLYQELGKDQPPPGPRLHPVVLRIRVSRRDPRIAGAVVQLLDDHRRPSGEPAIVVLQGGGHEEWVVAGPGRSIPDACSDATPQGVRDLVCPDPWTALGYPQPLVRAQTSLTQGIRSTSLHQVDWNRVILPGGVCGSSSPIPPHIYRYGPEAYIHPDVDLVWWNPVWVFSWNRAVFGDLDGDGRDEAALGVDCANGGGTADGQLASTDVIFKAVGRSMRVVGIVTAQQPLRLDTPHIPLIGVQRITRGKVVVAEYWYGPYDATCCSSGRATTTWTYAHGRLRPAGTTIRQQPWTSPLNVYDILGEPGDQELERSERTKVGTQAGFSFHVQVSQILGAPKRNVPVTLTIRPSSPLITQTKTIARVSSSDPDAATLVFDNLGPLPAGKATVTIDIHDPGAFPLVYPVIFGG